MPDTGEPGLERLRSDVGAAGLANAPGSADNIDVVASTSLCCEVNLAPPNPGSRVFHARAGFVAVDQLELADGRTVEFLTRGLAARGA